MTNQGLCLTTRVRARGEDIRRFILEKVEQHPNDICKATADKFGITRQAANKHIQRLTAKGCLIEAGHTRSRVYRLAPTSEWSGSYNIGTHPAEDVVWARDIRKALGQLPDNVMEIWQYGFTEMFNNALDHSGGTTIDVSLKKTAVSAEMVVRDNGEGIFRKIQAALGLLDERHALLELSKGKLTTDPNHHSGEGIFFTSRMFDSFDILSGGVYFSHKFGDAEDWVLESNKSRVGTVVWMSLHNHTARTMKAVFDQYSSGDDYGFTKTVVPVKLAQYGNDKLLSRSQAKRVLARVELFKTVIFDFEGVPSVGQAFADEIFRVFPLQHPDMELIPAHANSEVKRMIARARAGGSADV